MYGRGNPSTYPLMGYDLNKKKLRVESLNFLAALATALAGLFGILFGLFNQFFNFLDLTGSFYIFFFGCLCLARDAPFKNSAMANCLKNLDKFCKIVCTLTGKGLLNIFLGTMIFATLWESNLSPLFGFIFSSLVFLIGIYGVIIGMGKSNGLRLVKKMIKSSDKHANELYETFAKVSPEEGLQPDEFNNMAITLAQVQFHRDDLVLIFNSLTDFEKRSLCKDDFVDWISGSVNFV